jgi:sialidase-1
MTGIVPDRISYHGHKYYCGTHLAGHPYEQYVWKADLPDMKWKLISSTTYDCDIDNGCYCELSLMSYENTLYRIMRENSGRGYPGVFQLSPDDGVTWSDPVQTKMFGCHRPVWGRLQSGNILVTYREQTNPHRKGLWAKNTFAYLASESSFKKWGFQEGIILPLDHDNSKVSDGGYTGWVQGDKGKIHVVNYITGRAPKPFIRGYIITEADF